MRTTATRMFGILMLLGMTLAASQSVFAADGPPPAQVVVSKVVQQEVAQSRSVIGVLYYERMSDISTEVAGLVEEVKVRQGDRVQLGDTLWC